MKGFLRELRGLLGALAIALVIRTFLFQPFVIPSASMYPTMEIGDFLLVSKYTYGYSNYSFPFAPPLFEGRIWAGKPEQGQVVVFRNPVGETTSLLEKISIDFSFSNFGFKDKSLDFIKRLVGMPGDRIQVRQGILHINGEPVKLERVADYTYRDPRTKEVKTHPQYKETMPNGVSYYILKDAPFGQGHLDNTEEFVVPAGHYFFMGDNRDHSGDSRLMNVLGYVPEDHLIGPAKVIFFSTEARLGEPGDWITGIRPSRFFQMIH